MSRDIPEPVPSGNQEVWEVPDKHILKPPPGTHVHLLVREIIHKHLRALVTDLDDFEQTTHGLLAPGTLESVTAGLLQCYSKPDDYTISDLAQRIRAFLHGHTRTAALGGSMSWGAYLVSLYTAAAAPVASFTRTPASGMVGVTVSVTDTSTNTPTSWDWDWGDGTAHSTTQNPTHQYTRSGVFTITLTATNAGGSSQATATVTVNAGAGGAIHKKISESMKRLTGSGLTKRAVMILLKHDTGLSMRQIEAVIDGLDDLARKYTH